MHWVLIEVEDDQLEFQLEYLRNNTETPPVGYIKVPSLFCECFPDGVNVPESYTEYYLPSRVEPRVTEPYIETRGQFRFGEKRGWWIHKKCGRPTKQWWEMEVESWGLPMGRAPQGGVTLLEH